MKIIPCILSLIALLALIYGIGSVHGYYSDTVSVTGNTFTAFSSTVWAQNGQSAFQTGLPWQVEATDSGGVQLDFEDKNKKFYFNSGLLASQVVDTGHQGTTIDLITWERLLPGTTNITFSIRASDTQFAIDDITVPWVALGSLSPVSTGFPQGQYIQWRANLTTNKKQETPTLSGIQIWYH